MITTSQVHEGYSAYWVEYYKGELVMESVQLGGALVGIFLDENMEVLEWIYDDSITQFVINCCHWASVASFVYIGNSKPVQVALKEIELLNDIRGI